MTVTGPFDPPVMWDFPHTVSPRVKGDMGLDTVLCIISLGPAPMFRDHVTRGGDAQRGFYARDGHILVDLIRGRPISYLMCHVTPLIFLGEVWLV